MLFLMYDVLAHLLIECRLCLPYAVTVAPLVPIEAHLLHCWTVLRSVYA